MPPRPDHFTRFAELDGVPRGYIHLYLDDSGRVWGVCQLCCTAVLGHEGAQPARFRTKGKIPRIVGILLSRGLLSAFLRAQNLLARLEFDAVCVRPSSATSSWAGSRFGRPEGAAQIHYVRYL
jgi:hypothetical protein